MKEKRLVPDSENIRLDSLTLVFSLYENRLKLQNFFENHPMLSDHKRRFLFDKFYRTPVIFVPGELANKVFFSLFSDLPLELFSLVKLSRVDIRMSEKISLAQDVEKKNLDFLSELSDQYFVGFQEKNNEKYGTVIKDFKLASRDRKKDFAFRFYYNNSKEELVLDHEYKNKSLRVLNKLFRNIRDEKKAFIHFISLISERFLTDYNDFVPCKLVSVFSPSVKKLGVNSCILEEAKDDMFSILIKYLFTFDLTIVPSMLWSYPFEPKLFMDEKNPQKKDKLFLMISYLSVRALLDWRQRVSSLALSKNRNDLSFLEVGIDLTEFCKVCAFRREKDFEKEFNERADQILSQKISWKEGNDLIAEVLFPRLRLSMSEGKIYVLYSPRVANRQFEIAKYFIPATLFEKMKRF